MLSPCPKKCILGHENHAGLLDRAEQNWPVCSMQSIAGLLQKQGVATQLVPTL